MQHYTFLPHIIETLEAVPEGLKQAVREYLEARGIDIKLRIALSTPLRLKRPAVMIFDEFQDAIETFSLMKIDILGIMREIMRGRVLLVLSGSIRSIMERVVKTGEGRYFLQMERIELESFDTKSTWEMIEKIWGMPVSGKTVREIMRLTGGFPFYIHTVLERALENSKIFGGRPEDYIELSFFQEACSSGGKIYEHCRYLWTDYVRYAKRRALLRSILEKIAIHGELTLTDLAKMLGRDASYVQKYLDELLNLGLIKKRGRRFSIFNRVFSFWILARREIPEVSRIPFGEKALLERLRELERRTSKVERSIAIGFEAWVQRVLENVAGKTIGAREVGITKLEKVTLPSNVRKNPIKRIGDEVFEADLEFSNGMKCIVEVTVKRVDAEYLKEIEEIWQADIHWVVSREGFTTSAVKYAMEKENFILSDLEAINMLSRKVGVKPWR